MKTYKVLFIFPLLDLLYRDQFIVIYAVLYVYTWLKIMFRRGAFEFFTTLAIEWD
jgi:hypothetical protein